MIRKHFLLYMALVAVTVFGQNTVASSAGSTPPSLQKWANVFLTNMMPQGNSWEDKHFRDGLLRGKQNKGYFVLINDDNKNIGADKLIKYCKEHNYLYKDEYTTKSIKKFGTGTEIINEFYFLPKAFYIFYVFDWTERGGVPDIALTQKGSLNFYLPGENKFIMLSDALWSGNVVYGKINGQGSGIKQMSDNVYYYFSGQFRDGVPQGKITHRIVDTNANAWGYTRAEANRGGIDFYTVEIGEWNEHVASFRAPGNNNYGLVSADGGFVTITLAPTYSQFYSTFSNGKIAVKKDGKESYINKRGEFIDYTENQKKIFAEEKAEQERKKAEEERQKRLAEQKAAEEKRIADEKEAALQKRIDANKNPKLWSRGCRLAYRFEDKRNYVIATLEEWNDNRTKVKVKIVASPGARWQLNGEVLEKNNTMWVSVHNEGWHLALEEEEAIALKRDNSVYVPEPEVKYVDNSCSHCNGNGDIACKSCKGTGHQYWMKDNRACYDCKGRGRIMCSYCRGTGRK